MTKKPVIYYACDPQQQERIRAHASAPDVIMKPADAPIWLPPPDADVIFCSLMSWAKAPEAAPPGWPFNIRYIQFASAGIDTLPKWARGVNEIASVKGVTAEPIAEYAMAAILSDCKRIDIIAGLVENADVNAFDERNWPQGTMRTVKGQTIALLGYGAIAQAIAHRAEAFGMRVKALRRSAGTADPRFVHSLEALLAEADHLVLCAPATAETRHIMNDAAFAAIKPGCHLINVARGALVDQDALVRALDAGRLRKATLDVTEPEPLPADHPLRGRKDVVVTPHAAWFSEDHFHRVTSKLLENLERYAKGEPVVDRADFDRGY
jgi:phosphoglycerate dehydrogenase-like enzyme